MGDSKEGEGNGTITITSPQPDQTIRFAETGITVAVSVTPALQSGETINISLDGRIVASGSGSSFNVGEVYRGSHTLSASVVDSSGTVLFTSSPVTFYIQQHSILRDEP